MVGKLFIDSRMASKLKGSTRGVIDFLEVIEETSNNVTLKPKTAIATNSEWINCRTWSESITVKKEDFFLYLKNDQTVSGAVWLPVKNKYEEILSMLTEDRISGLELDKDLSYLMYSETMSPVKEILSKLAK